MRRLLREARMGEWTALTWERAALGAAAEALARQAGLKPSTATPLRVPETLEGNEAEALTRILADLGAQLGLELDHVQTTYGEVEGLLGRCAPALIRLKLDGVSRFLALVRSRGGSLQVLTPDLKRVSVARSAVAALVRGPLEEGHLAAVDGMCDATGVPAGRRASAKRALLRERIGAQPIGACWLLRLSPGRPFREHLRQEGVNGRFVAMTVSYLLQQLATIAGWWAIGRGALQGQADLGWIWAWALLLYTEIPLRLWGSYLQGVLFSAAGAAMKKRLLYGALRLDSEVLRTQGAGQLLSRVLESETIETISLAGGFQVILMGIQLLLALWLLQQSAAPVMMPVLLVGWIVLALLICRRHYRCQRAWSTQRLDMTHDLIEKMVGHRTRLAQESRANWHHDEDLWQRDYLLGSKEMDRSDTWMNAIIVRGWVAVALVGLGTAYLDGAADRTGLAIGLGGILMAQNGFLNLSFGFKEVMTALIAWDRVAPIFKAAGEEEGGARFPLPPAGKPGEALLQAVNLSFQYPGRRESVLTHCNLTIRQGDRILLEGHSGSGKSTLGSLLTGLRAPDQGLLLYRGLDRESLGGRVWRKQIASAPQFHENHVFTETFLFNLLMGRSWPPRQGDQELALEICQELGLGPLLARMPGGMLQMVGETGWQLSHGERSRLFIARTLLQGADLVVLDESFAALDPENLARAMACVRKHAAALLVIAHP